MVQVATAVSIPSSFYDALADSGSSTALRIREDKKQEMQDLWRQVCELGSTEQDGAFSTVTKDKQWFCQKYCGGLGLEREAENEMWDLIISMNAPHDPLGLVACVASLRDRFYKSSAHFVSQKEGDDDASTALITKHLVVHESCVSAEILGDFLLQTLRTGLSLETAASIQHTAPPLIMITDGKLLKYCSKPDDFFCRVFLCHDHDTTNHN